MRGAFTLTLGLAAIAVSAPAAAGSLYEFRGGVLAQGVGPFSPNKEDGVGLNAEVLFPKIRALNVIGGPRPQLGLTVATGEFATSQLYAGLSWGLDITPIFFVDGGVALAVHDGETSFNPPDPLVGERNYLGCRVLARLSADLGVKIAPRVTASLHADHMSNAGLCSENEGLDNAGLRLGVRL